MTDELLKALRENPEFKQVMQDAMKHRPVVSNFAICKTKDEQEMVVEAIKFSTGMRQGFDLLYAHLTGKAPNGVTLLKETQSGRSN